MKTVYLLYRTPYSADGYILDTYLFGIYASENAALEVIRLKGKKENQPGWPQVDYQIEEHKVEGY